MDPVSPIARPIHDIESTNIFLELGMDDCERTASLHHLQELGPMPKATLEALVDLGLTDAEIAGYFGVPKSFVTTLANFWDIQHDKEPAR